MLLTKQREGWRTAYTNHVTNYVGLPLGANAGTKRVARNDRQRLPVQPERVMSAYDSLRPPMIEHHLLDNWGNARRVFGERLARVIAVGQWPLEQGTTEHSPLLLTYEARTRLQTALTIAGWLLAVESPNTVRAWFVGRNPILDDQAPAVVLAQNPEKVRRAARDLVAHG